MNTNASYASVGSQQSYPQSTHASPVPNGSSGYNGNPPVPATPRYPDTRTDTSEDSHSGDRQGHVPKKALSRYFQASTGPALSATKRCQSAVPPKVWSCCYHVKVADWSSATSLRSTIYCFGDPVRCLLQGMRNKD